MPACGDCDDPRCIGCREVGDFYVLVPTYPEDVDDEYPEDEDE